MRVLVLVLAAALSGCSFIAFETRSASRDGERAPGGLVWTYTTSKSSCVGCREWLSIDASGTNRRVALYADGKLAFEAAAQSHSSLNDITGHRSWSGETSSQCFVLNADGTESKDGVCDLSGEPGHGHWKYEVRDRTLDAMRPGGSTAWSLYNVASAASADDRFVFVKANDENLQCLTQDQKVLWTIASPGTGELRGAIVGSDGRTYVFSRLAVFAVNDHCKLLWSHRFEDELAGYDRGRRGGGTLSLPAVAADGTIYVGTRDGRLWALNDRGEVRWQTDAGGPEIGSPAIGADGTLYFIAAPAAGAPGVLHAVSPDGAPRWTAQGPQPDKGLFVAGDGTLLGFDQDSAYAVRPDGSLRWVMTTPRDSPNEAPAYLRATSFLMVSPDGLLYAVTTKKGESSVFAVDTGLGGPAHPLWADNYRPGQGGLLGPKLNARCVASRASRPPASAVEALSGSGKRVIELAGHYEQSVTDGSLITPKDEDEVFRHCKALAAAWKDVTPFLQARHADQSGVSGVPHCVGFASQLPLVPEKYGVVAKALREDAAKSQATAVVVTRLVTEDEAQCR